MRKGTKMVTKLNYWSVFIQYETKGDSGVMSSYGCPSILQTPSHVIGSLPLGVHRAPPHSNPAVVSASIQPLE